jgi:bifunctional non-homologous end joining protein LigD
MLARLEKAEASFDNPPKMVGSRGVHWIRPVLVAQVQYSNFTRDGRLRHPSFKGLREDKPATSVRRDTPIVRSAPENEPTEEHAMPHAKKAARVKKSARSSAAKEKRAKETPTRASRRLGTARKGETEIEIAGVRVTHPDRVLYPEAGVTKRMLAKYYVTVADWILPHLANRPLSLLRCPGGQDAECFFQKHMGTTLPDWVRRVPIKESTGVGEYVVIENVRGLVALAQMSVLEIHPWGSRADDVDLPDRIIFDLDPGPEVSWKEVVSAARAVKDALAELGLVSFVKTTGGKGLHVVAPITRKLGWEEIKPFTRGVAQQLVAASPERFTANMSKATRTDKIFIDYLRNERGATAVAAYSSRARAAASVSAPLDWSELGRTRSADEYTVLNIDRRLKRSDPWQDFFQTKQALTRTMLKAVQV